MSKSGHKIGIHDVKERKEKYIKNLTTCLNNMNTSPNKNVLN